MDDLLVFSEGEESHYRHLENCTQTSEGIRVYIASKKFTSFQTELDFLGLLVGQDGLRVNLEKIEVLKTWPKPESLTDLSNFMGLLQFCRRLFKKFSGIAAPIINLTKKGPGIGKWDKI